MKKERQDRLRSFFKHYNEQIQSRSTRYVQTHAQLMHVMRSLRDNPSVPRKDISSKLAPVLANLDPDETIDADAALDLAVRITFIVSCRRTKKDFISRHIHRPIWNREQSLEAFMTRELPSGTARAWEAAERSRLQNIRTLNAYYLQRHANVKIKWTSNLLDHLFLVIKDGQKTLQLFKHMGFLEIGSKALSGQSSSPNVGDSIARYDFHASY